jgi:hypothetical protein
MSIGTLDSRAHRSRMRDRGDQDSFRARERQQNLVRQLGAVAARVDLLAGQQRSFDEEGRACWASYRRASPMPQAVTCERRLRGCFPGPDRSPRAPRRSSVVTSSLPIACASSSSALSPSVVRARSNTCPFRLASESRSSMCPTARGMGTAGTTAGITACCRVNLAHGITRDGALALACHEGYPGHHAWNSVLEADPVRRCRR